MNSHLTHEQLESFWAATAAQAETAHIRGCDLCRTRLAELIDQEEVAHIGRLYLMRERRIFATTEADYPSFGRFIKFVCPPS